MEKLEQTLEKAESRKEDARLSLVEKPIYEGLRKIEDKVYVGPTGARYWM